VADVAARLPLVLVPGLLCNELLWAPQSEALADIAAPWLADTMRHDNFPDMAAALLAAAPPGPFALAGLSMGGYVALEVMRQAPQRVARLALLDTNAHPDTPEKRKARQDFIALAERGRFLGVTDALLPLLVHPDRLQDATLVATIKTMAKQVGVEAFVRQERAIMDRIDSRPHLPAIRCPTLVLCGRDDRLTPLDAHEEIARGIPHAELAVIDDCGHLSTLERPEPVNAALRRWLTCA
jgi:pimeloyl-ACP methyl ester carboxylesterase